MIDNKNISFIFSLTTFFVATWIYLLTEIISKTREYNGWLDLMYLGFIHFLVFVYLIIALVLLYNYGLILINSKIKLSNNEAFIELMFFKSWPYILILALSFFCISTFDNDENNPKLFTTNLVLFSFFVGMFIFWEFDVFKEKQFFTIPHIGFLATAIMIGYFGYLLIMQAVFADVKITTDREFYKPGQELVFSVKESGYVLNPIVKKISISNWFNEIDITTTNQNRLILYKIDGNPKNRPEYIRVDYETPILNLLKAKYTTVNCDYVK